MQCFSSLVKGCANQLEHQLRIFYLYRRLLIAGQTDHRGTYIWSWDKAVWRHICHNIWACVVLHCQRQGAVILRSRSHLHTVCHFFLDHNRDIVDWHIAFKQSHDNRGSNVIWQIGNYFNRSAVVVFLYQFIDIHFQDILVDDLYIGIVF